MNLKEAMNIMYPLLDEIKSNVKACEDTLTKVEPEKGPERKNPLTPIDFLTKVTCGFPVTEGDIAWEYSKLCDRLHANSCDQCPVHIANGGLCPDENTDPDGCSCFKNGVAMMKWLREHYS